MWCAVCFAPVIWPDDVVDETAEAEEAARAAQDATEDVGSAGLSAAGSAGGIACTCGRIHPTGTAICPFGGQLAGGRVATASITLPGGIRIPLGPDPLVLGRLSPDVRVAHALEPFDEVSRRHATVRFDGVAVWISDTGSSFGTWVGGQRVGGELRLGAGDTLVELSDGRPASVTVHAPESGGIG